MRHKPVQESPCTWQHARRSRRDALQAGAIGILGLGMNHLAGLRQATASEGRQPSGKAKSCIFIFLSGGLSQHDSFDMKPEAPDNIRGEFQPHATKTPGLHICEHLPKLAERSQIVVAVSFVNAWIQRTFRSPSHHADGTFRVACWIQSE